MSLNPKLSENELKALLGSGLNESGAADIQPPAEQAEASLPSAMSQESELLHALKNVVKTLAVRVASLENEVGRLRAELVAAKRGTELPPAEERIVVEGVLLPALPVERETAASAEAAPLPQLHAAAAAALAPRADRHRKPKKKGFFSKLFDR